MRKGNTYRFLGQPYSRNSKGVGLQVGDQVIIHPIPGKSQATQSYPAVVVEKDINWSADPAIELCLAGRDENKDWHGAVLNDYAFSRLEFVKREI